MCHLEQFYPVFPEWVPWRERKKIGGLDRFGAYEVGIASHFFCKGREYRPFDSVPTLVYVGEAHAQPLRARISEFNRVAGRGEGAHSGGICFHNQGFSLNEAWLRVFPAPPAIPEHCTGSLAKLFERELIWRHCQYFGKRPLCNSE